MLKSASVCLSLTVPPCPCLLCSSFCNSQPFFCTLCCRGRLVRWMSASGSKDPWTGPYSSAAKSVACQAVQTWPSVCGQLHSVSLRLLKWLASALSKRKGCGHHLFNNLSIYLFTRSASLRCSHLQTNIFVCFPYQLTTYVGYRNSAPISQDRIVKNCVGKNRTRSRSCVFCSPSYDVFKRKLKTLKRHSP